MCILGLFGVCAKYDANDAIQNRQNNLFGELLQFCYISAFRGLLRIS